MAGGRSQARLRTRRGYDLHGRTAYNLGEFSPLTQGQQYRAARTAGYAPALPPATTLPVNTVAPAITGTTTNGQTLTCSTGTWTGTATITYTRQWRRNGVDVAGRTASTYLLGAADVGTVISCRVTASNAFADVSALSNNTATIA